MLDAFRCIAPELVLIGSACVLLLVAAFIGDGKGPRRTREFGFALAALVALTLSLLTALAQAGQQLAPVGQLFHVDGMTLFVRYLGLATGFVLLALGVGQRVERYIGEFYVCLLLLIAGVGLVGAANDLVSLFLALELISIPTYILLYVPLVDNRTQEAVTKYFLLSIFSSALLLYGFSLLFGMAGETNLTAIATHLAKPAGAVSLALTTAALVMVVGGFGFRIAAVPFHFYAPDVIEGTPTVGGAMLSFVPKIAGFVGLLRVISLFAHVTTTHASEQVALVLGTVAVASMFLGNIVALLQSNLKRLLAYSSIAHAGYMLVAASLGPRAGWGIGGTEAVLFYLAVYGTMTVGVFALLLALDHPDRPVKTVKDLSGLSHTQPLAALTMAILLFSLIGLPPTAGFWGKLNIVYAAWVSASSGMRLLAFLLMINAAIGAWYYLRLVTVMYLNEATGEAHQRSLVARSAGTVCAVVVLVLFFLPGWLWRGVENTGPRLLAPPPAAVATLTPLAPVNSP